MSLTLATFNVKNLLEPADEAGRAILPDKLEWIARMIHACDADVLGLQEVGPPALLAALLARVRSTGRNEYGEPVLGTPDARGIRCALLSRLPLTETRVHTAASLEFPVFAEGDPAPFGSRIPLRRGVVHARVEGQTWAGPVDVLVAHFKSPRPVPARLAGGATVEPRTARERAEGALRSLVWRAAEALYVRGLVDALLAADRTARVAVLGDLNDVPDSPVVSTLRGSRDSGDGGGSRDGGDGILLDCAAAVPEARRFSAMHDGRRAQIDHVLATASLYAHLREARFLNDELREHVFRDGEVEAPTIDSDHAPLVARFE
jgi:endonuclease/exonuclease/phosphatase family metal-dependent hydrolase